MKKFKGFTLIECLVALAVLGIAALIMAQIYANVSKINKENSFNNMSLAYQVKYAEKYIESRDKSDTTNLIQLNYTTTPGNDNGAGNGGKDTDGDPIPVDTPTKKGNSSTTSTPYLKIERTDPNNSSKVWTYSFAVDLYILNNRSYDSTNGSKVTNDVDKDGDTTDENHYLSYKYFLPHTNS